jgi:hypothetical protein
MAHIMLAQPDFRLCQRMFLSQKRWEIIKTFKDWLSSFGLIADPEWHMTFGGNGYPSQDRVLYVELYNWKTGEQCR